MPRWTLAAAFALGLLPGLIPYWSSRPAIPPVTQPVTQTASPVTPAPTPPPATTQEQPAPNRPQRAPTAVFDAAELARMLGERSDQLKAAQAAQADFTRQLRDPLHHSRIDQIDAALRALGKRIGIVVEAA